MERYIALLRGINVGIKRSMKMADLRALFGDIGYINTKTYIQSGNVIFDSKTANITELIENIELAIEQRFGFYVPVLVIQAKSYNEIINSNPYLAIDDVDIKKLHITFLSEEPKLENIDELKTIDGKDDEFQIIGSCIYLLCNGKYHESKLGNNVFEKKLKIKATTRNWKTALKLLELSRV